MNQRSRTQCSLPKKFANEKTSHLKITVQVWGQVYTKNNTNVILILPRKSVSQIMECIHTLACGNCLLFWCHTLVSHFPSWVVGNTHLWYKLMSPFPQFKAKSWWLGKLITAFHTHNVYFYLREQVFKPDFFQNFIQSTISSLNWPQRPKLASPWPSTPSQLQWTRVQWH